MAGVDLDDRLRPAIDAAVAAGAAAGHAHSRPVVLQHTNNVVVWLSPHPIVAKVGVWPHSRRLLERESELCAELADLGSPVVVPLRDSPLHSDHGLRPGAGRYGDAQLPVSLWRQVATRDAVPSADDVAAVLARVHTDLGRCDLSRLAEPLPGYLAGVELAHDALQRDDWMAALGRSDLALLRRAFDRWRARAEAMDAPERVLHGEPHANNLLSTSHGLVMIDFEGACVGPVEWDLASVAPAVVAAYRGRVDIDIDIDRLALLRALNSARVATWCFASEFPEMRPFGDVHLGAVRVADAAGL